MVTTEPLPTVLLRLPLQPDVLQAYNSEAEELEISLEELMANRLKECQDYTAAKPLYFDDDQRQRLETLLGRNVSKPSEALSILERLLSVRVNGIPVTLRSEVITRLRTRHFGEQEFGVWLAQQINRWASEFVGL